jgi:hypothetical protein
MEENQHNLLKGKEIQKRTGTASKGSQEHHFKCGWQNFFWQIINSKQYFHKSLSIWLERILWRARP